MKCLYRYRHTSNTKFDTNAYITKLQRAFPTGSVIFNTMYKAIFSYPFFYQINKDTVLSLYRYKKEVWYK